MELVASRIAPTMRLSHHGQGYRATVAEGGTRTGAGARRYRRLGQVGAGRRRSGVGGVRTAVAVRNVHGGIVYLAGARSFSQAIRQRTPAALRPLPLASCRMWSQRWVASWAHRYAAPSAEG